MADLFCVNNRFRTFDALEERIKKINLYAGFLAFRKLTFATSNTNLGKADKVYETRLANTQYFRVGVIYKFRANRYTNYIKNDELDWYREV